MGICVFSMLISVWCVAQSYTTSIPTLREKILNTKIFTEEENLDAFCNCSPNTMFKPNLLGNELRGTLYASIRYNIIYKDIMRSRI